MAVWSEIPIAQVMGAQRMDAEFFRPDYVEYEAAIERRNHVHLGDVAKTVQRGVQPKYDDNGEIPVIRTVNVRELELSGARQEFVTQGFLQDNPRARVAAGDLIITSTGIGTLGRVGYLSEDDTYCADGHIAYVRGIHDIHPLYVTTFLQTRIGHALIERRQRGSSGQMEVYPFDLATIPIPRFDAIEARAVELCQAALATVKRATAYDAEAEAFLESALGLYKLDLTPRLFYERPYADVQTAARFDAEYFQPRMQNLIAALSRDGQSIGDVAKLSKRKFKAKAGVEFQYIEIGDVSANGTTDSRAVVGEEAPSRATWIVKPGDVITTTVRPIRRLSAIIDEQQGGYVCSSGFAVLTPKDIAPELLLVYLRLPLVCELLDLHTTASMYPAIGTRDLMRIPIALPKDKARQKIVAKVRESFAARAEARRLLAEAKAMVEEAILGK